MDRIDRAILDQLGADSSLSNTDLADRVGLTPSPCLRRVRRLEEEGVILGYRASIAPEAVGKSFRVQVELELADQSRSTVESFEAALVAFDQVVEVRRMFGSPDYVALVAVDSLATYETFLTRHLMDLPGLARLRSMFTMKTLKAEEPWVVA